MAEIRWNAREYKKRQEAGPNAESFQVNFQTGRACKRNNPIKHHHHQQQQQTKAQEGSNNTNLKDIYINLHDLIYSTILGEYKKVCVMKYFAS